MGNRVNAKTKHNTELNKKLDDQISESLGYRSNKSNLNVFLQGFKNKLKKKMSNSTKISEILNDPDYILDISHKMLQNIFDSISNIDSYRTKLNISFPNSLFFYNILEENSNDQESFNREKVEIINSIFYNEDERFRDENLNKSERLQIEEADSSFVKSLEINSLKISSDTVKEVEEVPTLNTLKTLNNQSEEKIDKNNLILKKLNNNKIVENTNSSIKPENQLKNNKISYVNSNENSESNLEEGKEKNENSYLKAYQKTYTNSNTNNYTYNPDHSNNNYHKTSPIVENSSIKNTARNIKKSNENSTSTPTQNFLKETSNNLFLETKENLNLTQRSKSKTKKRNYNKAPVVNIKIDIKDFIKQDALEKSFLTERRPERTRPNKTPNKTMNISKDQTISNINDSSFVDVVDVLSETKREYVEAKKKKIQSKSPKMNNSKLCINPTFQDDRKSRIKYKNERYQDDQSPTQKRDNILKNLKSSKLIK